MPQTLAKIRKGSKHFEIIVDLDEALEFKKGESNFLQVEGDKIFTDSKKGQIASSSDLQEAFSTTDVDEVAKKIVKSGDIQTTQESRSAEQEVKFKQILDFLVTNAVDPQTGNAITGERLKNALNQANINIKNTSVESQIPEILDKLTTIIPIKIQTKKVKITTPAIHTGKVYGIIQQHKESEKWLDNGDLEVIANIPSGMIMDFYDKLNSITHGSALTEDIKE